MYNKNYQKDYYILHRDKKLKYQSKYNIDNKEERRLKKKLYYEKNKIKLLKDMKKYQSEHKTEIKINMKEYYKTHKEERKNYINNHKEDIKKYSKEWYIKNKLIDNLKSKEYYKNNKEKILKKHETYLNNRYKKDINFRLAKCLRSRIYKALKGNPKPSTTMKLVGCSIDFLKQHLESKFTEGMSWKNYGSWHVDHIIPCASFDMSKIEDQKSCFYYTNLQPLWAEENILKNNKILMRGVL